MPSPKAATRDRPELAELGHHRQDTDVPWRDVVVDSLPPIERHAVHHVHLDAAFRNLDVGRTVQRAYAQATDAIKKGLKRRGVVFAKRLTPLERDHTCALSA